MDKTKAKNRKRKIMIKGKHASKIKIQILAKNIYFLSKNTVSALFQPICRHTTFADSCENPLSQTVPHSPL